MTAGVVAGGITAVVSHPFDTISTLMQSDYNKRLTSTMRQTVMKLYQEEGMYGFFKGVTPRGIRVVLAIPLMNKVKNYLSIISGSQQKEE